MNKYDSDYVKVVFSLNLDEEDPTPQCVVCCEVLANESMRSKKFRRLIETKHSDLKNQPFQFFEAKLAELKTTNRNLLHFTKMNENALHASYLIRLRIAKAGKPHTICEFLVLPAIKDVVVVKFGDKTVRSWRSPTSTRFNNASRRPVVPTLLDCIIPSISPGYNG
jgi:hypothetical protein